MNFLQLFGPLHIITHHAEACESHRAHRIPYTAEMRVVTLAAALSAAAALYSAKDDVLQLDDSSFDKTGMCRLVDRLLRVTAVP